MYVHTKHAPLFKIVTVCTVCLHEIVERCMWNNTTICQPKWLTMIWKMYWVTVMSLSCHFHVTVMSLSCDFHVTVMWLSCHCHVTVMWLTVIQDCIAMCLCDVVLWWNCHWKCYRNYAENWWMVVGLWNRLISTIACTQTNVFFNCTLLHQYLHLSSPLPSLLACQSSCVGHVLWLGPLLNGPNLVMLPWQLPCRAFQLSTW